MPSAAIMLERPAGPSGSFFSINCSLRNVEHFEERHVFMAFGASWLLHLAGRLCILLAPDVEVIRILLVAPFASGGRIPKERAPSPASAPSSHLPLPGGDMAVVASSFGFAFGRLLLLLEVAAHSFRCAAARRGTSVRRVR